MPPVCSLRSWTQGSKSLLNTCGTKSLLRWGNRNGSWFRWVYQLFYHQLSYPDCWDRTVRLIRKSTWASASPPPLPPPSLQGDLGGQRTLQKKWTSFLKAKLVCSMPELNFVFNVVHDVFILKGTDWRDTVIYGVFTSQWSVFWRFGVKVEYSDIMQAIKLTSLPSQLLHHHHPLPGEMWVCQQCVPTTWLL